MGSRDPLAGMKVTVPADPVQDSDLYDSPSASSSVSLPPSSASSPKKGKSRNLSGGEQRAQVLLPPSEPEPALPAPLPPARVPEFEIVKDCSISWGGQFVKLKAGTRVSAARFGSNAEERLRAAGATLREVVD